MRKNSSDFNTSFVSEAGTFRTNKDYFAFMELDDMACWIAADGIDSDEDFESAEIAVKSVFTDFTDKPKMSRRKIKKYIKNAHRALKSESRNVRLKASIIVMITDYSKMIWAVAGNTRLYHFRNGKYNFRSKDQSIAQMMSDAGKINEYEINEHEERNNLTNYLGKADSFKPYISKKYKLNDGDAVILCTSGFWENVDRIEMTDAISDAQESSALVDNLEEMLLGRQNKILNNYTIAAVYANKVFKENPRDNMRWIKKAVAILIPVLILSAGFLVYKKIDSVKTRDLLSKSIKSGDDSVINGNYAEALKSYEKAKSCLEKIKDKEREDEVDDKCEIAQLIVEGDDSFNNKDYEKAKDNYLKARSDAEKEKVFDKKELEDKISKTDSYININNLEKEGDDEEVRKNYEGAIKKYTEARQIAEEVFSYDMSKELKAKIDEAQKAQSQAAEDKKNIQSAQNQAKDLESEGDKKSKSNDYQGAIKYYKMAQDRYNVLTEKNNQPDAFKEILRIEKKIESCEKKITSATPTPSIKKTTPLADIQ